MYDSYFNRICKHCGLRFGLHRSSDDSCPIDESSGSYITDQYFQEKRKKVFCKLCSNPTTCLETQLCDKCWELKTRIENDPKLAQKILDQINKPKLIIEFPTEQHREKFMGWLSDGGGEDIYIEEVDPSIVKFDYSKAYPTWGYKPATDGDPLISLKEE